MPGYPGKDSTDPLQYVPGPGGEETRPTAIPTSHPGQDHKLMFDLL